ncbi:expressed unknown protein [Seminavis robusta]|uniref:Uncharacterized protein n=1 Tax=Seminavis robusta TaxID=568900 RepID=A0A9N8HSA1_9STRA|nr:expressed unknown protein [Seminavis robusta]|eukprot:Sro1145_g246270.1 n/a (236) ;mRNA; r:34038-34745
MPSIGSSLTCDDSYICATKSNINYYVACSRDSASDAGTYSCIKATEFGQYSTCGPCNEGDFDASTCPAEDHNCAGSSGTKMRYCRKTSAADTGSYGCQKYSDMTVYSTCGECSTTRNRDLLWYEAKLDQDLADEPAPAKELFCSSESCKSQPPEDIEDDHEPYCLSDAFPCGPQGKTDARMVSVCHYSYLWGYHTLCIKEEMSETLVYFEHDYCGPCQGGFEVMARKLRELWERI